MTLTSVHCCRFYIGCDRCQDWFHGLCVGVTKAEADHMDSYVCPNCRRAGRDDDDISHQQLLVGRSWDQLQQLVRSLKVRLTHTARLQVKCYSQ